jgi:hypothetical protein
MSGGFKDKADLNSEVIAGVTYRQVRDAFQRLGGDFDGDIFGIVIWQDRINRAYHRETGYKISLNLKDMFRFDAAMDDSAV